MGKAARNMTRFTPCILLLAVVGGLATASTDHQNIDEGAPEVPNCSSRTWFRGNHFIRNPFVQSFLGPTTQFDGVTIRPHELVLTANGADRVTQIYDLGFEIRVTVERASGERSWIQLSRPEFLDTKIAVGDSVSVTRRHASVVKG